MTSQAESRKLGGMNKTLPKHKRTLKDAVDLLGGQAVVGRLLKNTGLRQFQCASQQTIWWYIHGNSEPPQAAVEIVLQALQAQGSRMLDIGPDDLLPSVTHEELQPSSSIIGAPGA